MRHQILKLSKKSSTKSERRFMELLKKLRIPFKTKVKINNREVDFLIKNVAIDIDCHEQDWEKNDMLVRNGYIPIHYNNKDIKEITSQEINKLWQITAQQISRMELPRE